MTKLCDLALDVLQQITELLHAEHVARLWVCGSTSLNRRLGPQGGVKSLKTVGTHDRATQVPFLVTKLPLLESFCLQSYVHTIGQLITSVGSLKLMLLPTTLRSLEISAEGHRPGPYHSYGVKERYLVNQRELDRWIGNIRGHFKELERLSIMNFKQPSSDGSPIAHRLPSALFPSTLTCLHVSQLLHPMVEPLPSMIYDLTIASFTPEDHAWLPPQLTSLKTGSSSARFTREHVEQLPRSLTRLHIPVSTSSAIRYLPPELTELNFLSTEMYITDRILALLPRGLAALYGSKTTLSLSGDALNKIGPLQLSTLVVHSVHHTDLYEMEAQLTLPPSIRVLRTTDGVVEFAEKSVPTCVEAPSIVNLDYFLLGNSLFLTELRITDRVPKYQPTEGFEGAMIPNSVSTLQWPCFPHSPLPSGLRSLTINSAPLIDVLGPEPIAGLPAGLLHLTVNTYTTPIPSDFAPKLPSGLLSLILASGPPLPAGVSVGMPRTLTALRMPVNRLVAEDVKSLPKITDLDFTSAQPTTEHIFWRRLEPTIEDAPQLLRLIPKSVRRLAVPKMIRDDEIRDRTGLHIEFQEIYDPNNWKLPEWG